MAFELNPYQSPDSAPVATQGKPSATFLASAVWLTTYLYPVLLAASFYAVWLVAWSVLGHRPRPSIDDPKDVPGVGWGVALVPAVLLWILPVAVPLGFFASFYCPFRLRSVPPRIQSWGLAIGYIALCAGVFTLLRSDPGLVLYWWMD